MGEIQTQGVEQGSATPAGQNNGGQAPQEDVTKIVASRLKDMRAKDRSELAAALGFNSWEDAMNSGLDKKLLDAGIDPEAGKPIINELVSNHPEVIKARQLIAETEKQKQNLELKELAQFGVQLESVDQLDEGTKSLMAKGISLKQAYIATHFEALQKATTSPQQIQAQSLSHMTSVPGTANVTTGNVIAIAPEDVKAVKQFMPNATEEDIKKFLTKHPEIKYRR